MTRQKFIQVQRHRGLHITACAVSKMANADRLPELEEYNNYFVEPNKKWFEDQSDSFAWVKVYYKLIPETDSVIVGQVQTIINPMTFLGESYNECWGELQFLIKNPAAVKLARRRSFDTRVKQWVEETKIIQPKTNLGNHTYLALRFYHQSYLPPVLDDWHFEPVYAVIAGEDFYLIDVIWQNKEIKITITSLDNNSSEIPNFLRQLRK